MGINFTFAAADGDTNVIGVRCVCADKLSCWCDDFDQYRMCEHTGDGYCEHNRFDVPMTNSSAQQVLYGLGYEFDYVGVLPADDLLARLAEAPLVHRSSDLVALASEAKSKRLSVGWS